MQVHAFARCIRGDQNQQIRIVTELFLGFTPIVPVYATVDGDDCLRIAQHAADAADEVIERVLVLGEDDHLATVTACRVHLGAVLQQVGELLPFLVVARLHDAKCLVLQVLEDQNFGFQLGDGFRRGGLIDDLVGVEFILLGA